MTWDNELFIFNHNSDSVSEIICKKNVCQNNIWIGRTENFLVCWEMVCLKVWNINDSYAETTAFACRKVTSIFVKNNLVALMYSGNCDILDIKSGKVDYKITGRIRAIDIDDDLIAFATEDGAIKVLHWQTKSLTTISHCNEQVVNTIEIKTGYMISFWRRANRLESVSVWNLQTKDKLHTFTIRRHFSGLHWLNPRTFLVKGDNDRLEAWDFLEGRRRFLINDRLGLIITKIRYNDHFIFTWKHNSSVLTLWCSKTGCFMSCLDMKERCSLVTNTKLALLRSSDPYRIFILDFEKKIT